MSVEDLGNTIKIFGTALFNLQKNCECENCSG